jgi:hypothetical protein
VSGAPSYLDLLHTAYVWGRMDGLLADDLEPPEGAGPSTASCRGREAEDFARQLWDLPGTRPPAGLEANAPHWYAHGFQDALAEVRGEHNGAHSPFAARPLRPSTAYAG